MSKLTEWIDDKFIVVKENVDDFLIKEGNLERINNINIHPIFCCYLALDNDYKKMSEREFNDPEEVLHCLIKYQEIMAYINEKCVFVPSIETFCMFMGWTAQIYHRMLNEAPSDIRETMQMIEDYILESQLSASQRGFLKGNITKFRTQVAGAHGQGLVTQKEQNMENNKKEKFKNIEELKKDLINMGVKGIE